jgi:hypothetical protein
MVSTLQPSDAFASHASIKLGCNIEIGLEHAPFFSSFDHAKNLLIMGPNNTKNSSFKCYFLIINYE